MATGSKRAAYLDSIKPPPTPEPEPELVFEGDEAGAGADGERRVSGT